MSAALALLALATTARLGQPVRVDGPTIRPDRVIEDSRCSQGVACVWAGRLVVRATVLSGPRPRTIDLTLGQPVSVADGMLTLIAVSPKRNAGTVTRPRDYRFTFRFDGGL